MKALKIRVEGIVQGVGFRYFTRRIARTFGIKGYVMNMDDGSVFIHAEGEERKLRQFLNEVSKGPPAAVVTNVSVEETVPKGYGDFTIRYY
ncbi:acylphosphatase [Thermotoga sp.]|uniref:acylphosphatase n=1 Tax=Thermotoga sp. TaxID=28240 RepID=UPI0025E8900B|nr:acylphosphatase [Thermotoga sp.]MCD6550912.1 acylphosphatase [Thermotoga sp.]